MASGYGIGSIGTSYMNDPYLMYALNSYNPNFMGTQSSGAMSGYPGMPEVTTPYAEPSVNTPTTTVPTEESGSNTGLIVGGALATAAAVGALVKGKGNPVKGVKAIWKSLSGKGEATTKEAVKEVSDKIKAFKSRNGSIVYTIPGRNKTIKNPAEIQSYAQQYGIDLKQLSKFNSEKSKLTEYKFKYEDGGRINTVTVKNGEITDINNGTKSIKEILESTNGDDIKFVEALNKRVNDIEKGISGNQSAYKDLFDIRYQTQIGDNIVNMSRSSIGSKAKVEELTTLERFGQNSEALKAYLYNNPEAKNIFLSKEFKKGKLPQGMKVESFDYNFNKDIKCHYKNDKLAGITVGGKYYERGTDKCDAFLADNEDIIKKQIDKLFKDGKVPNNINAVLVAA